MVLSLAEVDKGVRDVLNLEEEFDAEPDIMRAFSGAKGVAKSKVKLGLDFVERSEFKIFLLYYEQFEMFEMVDISGDKRINRIEIKKAPGHLRSRASTSTTRTLISTALMRIREDSFSWTSSPIYLDDHEAE